MLLPDVNVLVGAFRPDSRHHAVARSWLEAARRDDSPLALADSVLASFIRIVTNRRIFVAPATIDSALLFCLALTEQENILVLRPGARHWQVFLRLCVDANATGDLVPDAYLAALAIEQGCELVTFDRGFGRYPGLRWSVPAMPGA